MPTYEYQCVACNDRFERFQRMSDPAVTNCPKCDGAVRKVMHAPAIAFKGPGFYVNDYKKPNPASTPQVESAGTPTPKSGEASTPVEAPKAAVPATASA
ncbi:MAG TPA: FmdB family zinc ribbon protein [Armatimonadota bacterium]|jgi:putative FmdB family regulatory protein